MHGLVLEQLRSEVQKASIRRRRRVLDALVGLLGAGHASDMQVLVTLKDERSCVIAGPAKGLLLQTAPRLGQHGVIAMRDRFQI